MKRETLYVLILTLVIAAIFRFAGINWDDNAHLHPDERFLTMVTTGIHWPDRVWTYFDTAASPLNPHNRGFSFFVYGTYPILLTKAVAQVVHQHTYDGITHTGRVLSGIADLITLCTVFFITRYLASKTNKHGDVTGLIAAFLYAIAVLPIQLSHFFTVDPYVTLFTTIALWRIIRGKLGALLGIVTALAVSAKISAAPILLLVGIAYLYAWIRTGTRARKRDARRAVLFSALRYILGFCFALPVLYPYLFDHWRLNPALLANWRQLLSFDQPSTTFPPGIQWTGVSPFQPILDLFVWGIGIPMTALLVVGAGFYARTMLHKLKHKDLVWLNRQFPVFLLTAWVIGLIVYEGTQYPKPMRYLWSIYPALTAVLGYWAYDIVREARRVHTEIIRHPATLACISILLILWPLSFLHIYLTPNTRVLATSWIYTHIPSGKTIAWESWDDPLPFPRQSFSPGVYHTPALPVFDPDSPEKWKKISAILSQSDYLILSSNRGYGAIGRAARRFPQTVAYYRKLFSGELGFTIVARFISRPTIPIPGRTVCLSVPGFVYGRLALTHALCPPGGIEIVDDYADETFTVYDHPVVTIFRKTQTMPYEAILEDRAIQKINMPDTGR